jgi:hypothetical protein
MDAIRKQLLDLTHERAWPAPFQMRGQPAEKQPRRKNPPKYQNKNKTF